MKCPEAMRDFLCVLCDSLNFSEKMNTSLMVDSISYASLEVNKI